MLNLFIVKFFLCVIMSSKSFNMSQLNIYESNANIFEKSFSKLMELVVSKGHRINIVCESRAQVEDVDKLLWSYAQLSFLPHATDEDDNLEKQPIVVGEGVDNFNKADVVVLLDLSKISCIKNYKKTVVFFKNNQKEKESLNSLKKSLQSEQVAINHYVQTEDGKWNLG